MSPRRLLFGVCFCLVITFLVTPPLRSQLPTSTLNGIVTDPKDLPVAGAKITLTNQATAVTRESKTGSEGQYVFAELLPGVYTLRIEAQGFATREYKGVRLEVGRTITQDVRLELAQLGQQVTVSEAAAGVDLTESEVQGQVTGTTVENIPLNGRNFLELAFLLPGNRNAPAFDPTKTQTVEVSSAGQLGRGGNISVDGGDNNDEVVGGPLSNFPQDSVREFQIVTNRYTAEVGRSGSSIVNIVTKSGTNEYHGSGFIFVRNKKLQGLPATFDRTACSGGRDCKPPFDRQQYGGSAGGPILKDRAWVFISGENRHQNASIPVGFRNFTSKSVIASSAGSPLRNVLASGRLDFKLTDHDSAAIRYSYNRTTDVSNGSLQGPAFGSAENRQSSFNRFHSLVGEWTHTLGPNKVNTLLFHYDKFINIIPGFSPNAATTTPSGLGKNPSGANSELVFPSLEDGATFRAPQETLIDRSQIRDTFSWTRGTHTIHLGGEFQNFGSPILFDLYGSSSVFLTEDFASQDRNGDGVIDDRDIPIVFDGGVLISTAPKRPAAAPTDRDSYIGLYVQDDWRARSNLTFNLGLRWELDTDVFGEGPLHGACPAPPTVPTSPCLWLRTALGLKRSRDPYEFGPRIGFAWDPLKKGTTVIRGGYGLYYDRVVLEPKLLELLFDGRRVGLAALNGSVCHNAATGAAQPCSDPNSRFNTGTPTLVSPYTGSPSSVALGLFILDNASRHPRVQQWSLGVQHQIGRNWIVSADGIHNFGSKFLMGRTLRDANNATVKVVDPLSSQSNTVTDIGSFGKTWYDGLLVGLKQRPVRYGRWSFAFNASYTLSKSFNYANDDQIPFKVTKQADVIMGGNNLRLEKGYATNDERHRFVLYGVFELPLDFTVSPIWTYSSNVPGDPILSDIGGRLPIAPRNSLGRDIKTGADLNKLITVWNNLPLCPVVPTNTGPFPCNAGPVTGVPPTRSRLILAPVNPNLKFGDNFNSLDVRITKAFKFWERHRFELIAEAFNLFNITNIRGSDNLSYWGFDNNISSNPATNLKNFNQPRNTAGGFFGSGGPRAFQFALRYSF